jgi:cyclopropane-fatty-acyl-phospholipid synthase
MSTLQMRTQDSNVQTTLAILEELLADYGPRNFAVHLWEGTTWEPAPGHLARFTLVLKHPGALRQMFWLSNGLGLPEAYIYDDFDIEGDCQAFFDMLTYLMNRPLRLRQRLSLAYSLWRLPSYHRPRPGRGPVRLSGRRHSPERDRQAVSYHYDVSNDFYELFLDRRMAYSCAYFSSPDEDLDTAQERKLDYLCRKMRLQPGQRLLDIGCGWGGLVQYAAEKYGVKAVGITLSQPQMEFANDRIRRAGLQARCRVEIRDYRELDDPEGYDRLVSVCMFEHVGAEMLPKWFEQAWRLLRPGGTFLNQGIVMNIRERMPRRPTFAQKYIFPDGELVPLHQAVREAEKAGFEVRDVESLREHYVYTLREWLHRLEAHAEEACHATDEPTYRAWRIYMAATGQRFRSGYYNLYQTLMVKPDDGLSGLPLTRADWYART